MAYEELKYDVAIANRVLSEIGLCTGPTRAVGHASLRDPKRSAYERLAGHIRGQAKALVAEKDRRGCLMAKSAAELGATDDAVEKKVELAYTTWRAELVACIKEAQRDGTVDAKQNPQALAGTLLAFMRGQEALHKGGAKPAQLKAAADEMVSLIPTG